MQTFCVKESARLFDYLMTHIHGIKKSTLKEYLRLQFIFVNGKPVRQFDYLLQAGDTVAIERNKSKAEAERFKSQLKIVYEDPTLIVIEKPSGLLTVATEKQKKRTAYFQVHEYLKASKHAAEPQRFHVKPVFIVHRLDQDASGLLVLAKTVQAKDYLQEHWHEFEKKYYAVVEGLPVKTSGEISSYLKENKILRVFSSPDPLPGSKRAVTRYRVLKACSKRTLLDVTLDTGRKHQIRVHMAQIGHPILGDRDYGNGKLAKRLALHAYQLSLRHPLSHKWMTFKSEMPKELEILL